MSPETRCVFTLMALLTVLTPKEGAAQHLPRRQETRPTLYALLGSMSSLQNLNDSGTDFFGGGAFIAGGVRLPLGEKLAGLSVGGDVGWTRLTLNRPTAGSGTKVTFLFYGLHMAYTFVNARRFSSAAFMGGGGVTINPSDGSGATKTRPSAFAGVDFDYAVSAKFQAFARGSVLAYRVDTFSKTSVLGDYAHGQSHLGLGVGVAMRL